MIYEYFILIIVETIDHNRQTIVWILYIQGFMFTVPRVIWKFSENGKIRKITESLREIRYKPTDDENKYRRKQLVDYVVDTLNKHNIYAVMYFLCEVNIQWS